jgi:hypothetical protein
MAGKLSGSAIVSGSISSTQLDNSLNTSISQGGGPKVTQIQITDSSYNVLDDTAVSLTGGYIKITGTGFSAGAVVIIGTINATATAFISSTTLNVQVPALSAGTYTVYVVNSDGGVAIAVNGLTYSAEPNWVTGSTLPAGTSNSSISIQLNATDATTYTLQEGSSLPDGLTLTSGGLLSGTVTVNSETVYSFTIIAIDNELQDSPRTFNITINVGDPYFYLTTLLLPGNGTNNQNNNVFLDSSNNNLAITRFGNTTQGTFSPFSQTGWSNYFDGNEDYLSAASGAAGNLFSGDFTIELWFFPTTSASTQSLIQQDEASWRINTTGTQLQWVSSGGVRFTSSTNFILNQWNHMAVIGNGSSIAMYINGVSSGSNSSRPSNSNGNVVIGINTASVGPVWPFLGYISNVRIVKGTAVYTSAFTPPTAPLTAIANTSLLTCQSNRFIDNSTNNFTITRNGDTSVQAFSPFNPTSAWSAENVGGSAYFDGSGDYLQFAKQTTTSSFTCECWFYRGVNAPPSGQRHTLFSGNNISSGGEDNVQFYVDNNGTIVFVLSATGLITTSSNLVLQYQWNHIAWVRNGSSCAIFVNGIRAGTATSSAPLNVTSIGSYYGSGYEPIGYISSARITTSAVYDVSQTTYTMPTGPLTNIENTYLLCNFTNAGITDATSKNILETVGDAKISTIQSKFGGSSMFFDGTGDYVVQPSNINYGYGTGDFTIEFWLYLNTTTIQTIVSNLSSASSTNPHLYINTTIRYYTNNADRITGSSLSTGVWYHVALCRASGSTRLFVDGAQSGSTYSDTNNYGASAPIGVGTYWSSGLPVTTTTLNGYIDDLRITKGYARYTTNFTPPTSAFLLQ